MNRLEQRPTAHLPQALHTHRLTAEPVVLLTGDSLRTLAVLTVALRPASLIATAQTLADALRQLRRLSPDILVLAVDRSLFSSVLLARTLLGRVPSCRACLIAQSEQISNLPPLLVPPQMSLVTMPRSAAELVGDVTALIWGGSTPARLQWTMNPLVGRAVSYLADTHIEPLRVGAIASALGVSERKLAGAFRPATGLTLREFQLAIRLEIAKLLLDRTDLKLSAVAVQTGFCDAPHLSRLFRAHLGRKPGEFRQSRRHPPTAPPPTDKDGLLA